LLSDSFSHSEKLHLFISEVLDEAELKPEKLNAIAVSKGPGSYTGLRIGVAAAKGLCFALDLPLIALNSLEVLVQSVSGQNTEFVIPMLDARRMEVYTALFDGNRNWKHQTSALVLTENSFKDLVEQKKVFILGDGAKKFQELNPKIRAQFSTENNYPNANDMVELAWQKYKAKDFESLAYFEPFYLKDFQTTPPKKKTNS
jgi:tRNA threonylcarbamoyladenosine biosynthesis protein TsaB